MADKLTVYRDRPIAFPALTIHARPPTTVAANSNPGAIAMATYKYRDAITGRYVDEAYAQAHPATTVRERVGLIKRIVQAARRTG